MITKVGYELNYKKNIYRTNQFTSPQLANTLNNKLSYDSFVSFGAKKRNSDDSFREIIDESSSHTRRLLNNLGKKNDGVVTPMLILNTSLHNLYNYLLDLDEQKKVYPKDRMPELTDVYKNSMSEAIFTDKNVRKRLIPVVKRHLDLSEKILERERAGNKSENSKNGIQFNDITLSDDFVDNIKRYCHANPAIKYLKPENLLMAFLQTDDGSELEEFVSNMNFEISMAYIVDSDEDKEHFRGYNHKSEEVYKQLTLGNDVFITYDLNKQKPKTVMDPVYTYLKENMPLETKVIELNEFASDEYLRKLLDDIKSKRLQNFVLILNPKTFSIDANDDYIDCVDEMYFTNFANLLENKPENVQLVLCSSNNEYETLSGVIKNNSFTEVSMPAFSPEKMLEYFNENPHLLEKLSSQFTPDAKEKVIRTAFYIDGVFPKNTIDLFKKIENKNLGKSKITIKDVDEYLSDAKDLLRRADDGSSIIVLLDTNKSLSDMTGKESTKKDAQLLVDQILNNELGTKGVLIYSQDGTPGAGRHFTAKAIAGDAHVPYIETNAIDFTTEEVEALGDTSSPVTAMKKLFSLVKNQAETNSHKSAVLFIENFEYLSIAGSIDRYNDIAMAQLIREMKKAQNEGFNILVMGSIPNTECVGDTVMKSLKFNDNIAVASPWNNATDREKIISKALKDNNVKFASDNDIMKYAVNLTQYNSYLAIKLLIQKAKSVAKEKGHSEISNSDLTEAYLRINHGRPCDITISDHRKRIVASHECGHATNREVLNMLAKSLNKPWRVPNKVNFITLDERGDFGGCVNVGIDGNEEEFFETSFADLVCTYGGYSAEKRFFNQDGSGGLSSDMECIKLIASLMVRIEGMGPTVGTANVQDYENVSDKMKEKIENDEKLIIENAKAVSDMITNVYAGFNEWFTEKYSPLVGTGDCIIDGDEFRAALQTWCSEQSPEKQAELAKCDQAIIKIMELTKKGIPVKRSDN